MVAWYWIPIAMVAAVFLYELFVVDFVDEIDEKYLLNKWIEKNRK